ncbi:hypothetical protein [Pleurocapsa sp. FMAR1]|uniref:hypothetical protein n=1 Tax=Pleurocapsa sp. FMAR1 TaxID=3040204 RepID=UPI0029C8E0F4|nr:hypothetical protein [Pleurocapsa sp. FMAR1]
MNSNNSQLIIKKAKSKITWTNNTNLIIFAFSTVFYARIVCSTFGVPSIVTQAHFLFIPVVFWIILTTAPTRDVQQIKLVYSLLSGLFLFLLAIVTSAFWNETGFINAVVSFMMLGEPIIFLIAIVSIPMSASSCLRLKKWLMWSALINFVLAAVQKPLIDADKLYAEGFNGTDGCGGVFFVSGAGNYVSASVSFAFALYFFNDKKNPLLIRLAALIAAFWQLLFSDSKQLILAYVVAWILLILLNSQDLSKTIRLIIGLLIFGLIFFWCTQNLEEFSSFTAWARPELYKTDGEAWYAKFYGVRSILDNFKSPLNWLFGLGPGTTVSRLGAWFINDYWSILGPLGATDSSIGKDALRFVGSYWLTYSSSLFSPIFGWAGIWGDLGLFGLGTYLFLAYLVWQNFGLDNSLKITLLSTLVLGFIFTQMEEPGYMLSVSLILGLAWHDQRLNKQRVYLQGHNR